LDKDGGPLNGLPLGGVKTTDGARATARPHIFKKAAPNRKRQYSATTTLILNDGARGGVPAVIILGRYIIADQVPRPSPQVTNRNLRAAIAPPAIVCHMYPR
jgi:hypothetical protein